MASIDSGSAAPTTGIAEMTATAVSLPMSTRSRQYSAEKQSMASGSPQLPCGKPVPHSPDSRKWVCTSTTISAGAGAAVVVVVEDVDGPLIVVVASSRSVAAVSGTVNVPPGSVPCERDRSSLHDWSATRPDAMPAEERRNRRRDQPCRRA